MRHTGGEGTVQCILSLVLDGDEWSALHPFTLKEEVSNVQLDKKLDGTQSLPSKVPEGNTEHYTEFLWSLHKWQLGLIGIHFDGVYIMH
jgi:Ni,Fe-hydrogenase III component G